MENKDNPNGIQRPFKMDQMSSWFADGDGFRGRVSARASDVTCAVKRSSQDEAMADSAALMHALEWAEKNELVVSHSINGKRVAHTMIFAIDGKWYATYRVVEDRQPVIDWTRFELPPHASNDSDRSKAVDNEITRQLNILR
ncbi:hypothetical protein [Janthinobacterium sp. SUN206]|uniref:hypothetical protein n=1 Tax=Janthinobacterium sp. SUN206 TaxID=3014787 RepID=UPI0027136B76|nr:hypothetical protein [Janthinobacterium sp. SUN206]MDO8065588.1 hypothetical protein [Janthinobacterium sp. SUN206]